MLYTDATPEALAWSLAKKWPSGGVLSSEAGAVFGSPGMGKDSVMRNLALLNQLWDGVPMRIDRKTTECYAVKNARLTMALQVQEPTLREFFTRSGALARGTGFLARFLVAWPESTQGTRFFTEPPANWPYLAAFTQRLAAILETPVPIATDGSLAPSILTLSAPAKVDWIAFHDSIEHELANGKDLYDVRDVASKTADNAVRLAALFQVFQQGTEEPISPEAFAGAKRIAAWHLAESRRFFGELALSPELVDTERLDNWLLAYSQRERTYSISKREVQRYGPIRHKIAFDAAIADLVALERIRIEQEGKRVMLKLNPTITE